MKKLKKFASILLAMLLTCCISVGFVGCAGAIASGTYADDNPYDEECYVYTRDVDVQTYFKIRNKSVSRVRDGVEDYRARIVVTKNGIYFEGYKWQESYASDNMLGYNDNYLVEYNKKEKSFTLTLVGYIE